MNHDLDTPDGMANAVAWTNQHLAQLRENGLWIVPRSGTVVQVRSHEPKRCRLLTDHEPAIKQVLQAAGWYLITDEDELAELRAKLREEYACGFDSPFPSLTQIQND